MDLPDLSRLSLKSGVREAWLNACGTRPNFKSWKNMRGRDKYRLLHGVAAKADDDVEPDGDYVSAYEQVHIDDMQARKRQ